MRFTSVSALAFAGAFMLTASSLQAQESEDPAERARFRFGALRFTPAIEVTSLGHDSNIFNELDDPKADTTAAIGPSSRFWLLAGASRLSGRVSGQYLYFRKYDNQRSWNTNNELKWEVPLARITPFVAGTYINSKERHGYEIDSRSRRRDVSGSVGTALRLSGKTDVVASVRQFEAKYDERETFLGAALADALNRTEQTIDLQVRHKLTPLTTFVVDAQRGRDRFATSEIRDSDSLKVMPGFELQPFALISGSAFVGVRRFDAVDSRVPDFQGVVAAVKARYTMLSTRFDVKVDRDLSYSYEVSQPYYALIDLGLIVTQRVTYGWELVGRTGWHSLDYRQLTSDAVTPVDRVERGHEYGAGIGYRVGETFRIGVDVLYATRRSEFMGVRNYEGYRVFSSISYGLPQ